MGPGRAVRTALIIMVIFTERAVHNDGSYLGSTGTLAGTCSVLSYPDRWVVSSPPVCSLEAEAQVSHLACPGHAPVRGGGSTG